MATENIFKQLLQVIQNKRRINKGIVRRPLENTDGFVSNLYNYELDDGVAKVRLGTRVMNAETDDLWYTLDSFRIGDMDILIGINYKREVWAWLDKWPETNFKVCNSSPFVRYQKKSSGGDFSETRQLIFQQGNKFWLEEDNLGIIIINDYGEAYRIMKKGSVRIEEDGTEFVTSRTSNVYKSGSVLRLYLDIKNATNKVFDREFYLMDDKKKAGWRIAGDVRMAYVNEMDIVSELSEPINLNEYQHVMASLFPVFDVDPNEFAINVKRLVKDGATADNGSTIYEGQYNSGSGGIQLAATSGNTWNLSIPGTEEEADALMIAVYGDSGVADNDTGLLSPLVDIPEGLYLCVNPSGLFNWLNTTNPDAGQYIGLTMAAETGQLTYSTVKQVKSVVTSFPRIERSTSEYIYPTDEKGGQFIYDLTLTKASGTEWLKLSDSPPEQWKHKARQIEIADSAVGNDMRLKFNGLLLQTSEPIKIKRVGNTYLFSESMIHGFEFPVYDGQATLLSKGYFDTWTVAGESAISIEEDFDEDKMSSAPDTSAVSEFDVAIRGTKIDYFTEATKNFRIALWNNDSILAKSQRFFYDNAAREIVYESDGELDTGYFNWGLKTQNMRTGASPVVAMDNTGIRKISMPLPLVRRAMRNPQHVSVSGGKLYVVEDNKLWFGSSAELMLTNEVELQSGVYGIAEFDSGVVVTTKSGMFYVAEGQYQKVYNSDGVVASFIAPCSGGCIAVEDKDVYLVTKHVTDSGSWYPVLQEIGTPISEVNFVGSLKSTSIGYKIYLADDWNVWVFNLKTKAWSGVFNYGSKIQMVFRFNNKLGVSFCSDIDKRNSFDTPVDGAGA